MRVLLVTFDAAWNYRHAESLHARGIESVLVADPEVAMEQLERSQIRKDEKIDYVFCDVVTEGWREIGTYSVTCSVPFILFDVNTSDAGSMGMAREMGFDTVTVHRYNTDQLFECIFSLGQEAHI